MPCSKVMATDLPWPDMFPRISFRMHALPRNMPNMSSQEAYTGLSIAIHANRRFSPQHHASGIRQASLFTFPSLLDSLVAGRSTAR